MKEFLDEFQLRHYLLSEEDQLRICLSPKYLERVLFSGKAFLKDGRLRRLRARERLQAALSDLLDSDKFSNEPFASFPEEDEEERKRLLAAGFVRNVIIKRFVPEQSRHLFMNGDPSAPCSWQRKMLKEVVIFEVIVR